MRGERYYIGVIGAGECDSKTYSIAEEVGKKIAAKGGIMVCGGLGGVMEAACRGAKEAGGTTIGILPSNSRDPSNSYLDIALPTGLGEGRNFLIARTSDILIAIGGEYGTLSEIGLSLKIGKKVIGINTWELYRSKKKDRTIIEKQTAEEAVEAAFELLGA